jgi:hypothetical protein
MTHVEYKTARDSIKTAAVCRKTPHARGVLELSGRQLGTIAALLELGLQETLEAVCRKTPIFVGIFNGRQWKMIVGL